MNKLIIIASLALTFAFNAHSAPAGVVANAKCAKDFQDDFPSWLADVKRDAAQLKVSEQTWKQALPFMEIDKRIVGNDRQQKFFYKTFLEYEKTRDDLIPRGRQLQAQYANAFAQIEQRFGVPGPIILAFWGMETSFALKAKGNYSVLKSTTTLAYDCRRPALFRESLLAALLMIQQFGMSPAEMMGEGAGEMTGLQFTPAIYYKYAIHIDGVQNNEPLRGTEDMLATAAFTMKDYGWQAGQPWLQEVRVPKQMPWQEADLSMKIQHPVEDWIKMDVRSADGRPLPAGLPASLMLPMGKDGPAFLAYPNFRVLLKWNASLNNALTAGYIANRIADPQLRAMNPGTVEKFPGDQMENLQNALMKPNNFAIHKIDIGNIDGQLGTGTRAAVKIMQQQFKLPADAYPTMELLNRLSR